MTLIRIHHYPAVIREAMDAVRHPPIAPGRYVDGWRAARAAHVESGCAMTIALDKRTGGIRHYVGPNPTNTGAD